MKIVVETYENGKGFWVSLVDDKNQVVSSFPAPTWMALLGRLDRLIQSDDASAKYSINLPEIPTDYRQTLKGDRSANATV